MNAPMSGRKAQAARNDTLIVEAARRVFVAEPSAPIAAVAEAAGVGISALYRRYPSKEDLLRKICADGLETYTSIVRGGGRRPDGDPWDGLRDVHAPRRRGRHPLDHRRARRHVHPLPGAVRGARSAPGGSTSS